MMKWGMLAWMALLAACAASGAPDDESHESAPGEGGGNGGGDGPGGGGGSADTTAVASGSGAGGASGTSGATVASTGPAGPSTAASTTSGGGACKKCSDLLSDETTQLGELCPASQSIAQALGMCACGSCSAACADICGGMAMQPSQTCMGCMQTTCSSEYQSCMSDA
jgi:hypothetical protein